MEAQTAHLCLFPHWYSDETSIWTLDYPPFFAYIELFLSVFANLIDPQIGHLQQGLNYSPNAVLDFQRISVILSDLCLFYGVYRFSRNWDQMKRKMIWVLVVWSPMLVIVDHLHIQYNGFLLGILLISLSCLEEGRDLMGGLVFAVLLCFKHSFVVAAPVYFVYLLRHYCWKGLVRGFWLLSVLGAVVVAGCFYIGIWPVCVSWAGYPCDNLYPGSDCLICLSQAWRHRQPWLITRWVAYAYT